MTTDHLHQMRDGLREAAAQHPGNPMIATHLQALEDIATAPAHGVWTPVKTALPPPWECVLVWALKKGDGRLSASEAYLKPLANGSGEWVSTTDSRILWRTDAGGSEPYTRPLRLDKLTHWMPMPAGP